MIIFLLLIISFDISVKADDDLFVETSKNCYEYAFFEKMKDISLLHCGMKCLQRTQCQCLSYNNNNTGECRLHSFLASECSIKDNNNQVTLQKKSSNVSCVFETIDIYLSGMLITAESSVDNVMDAVDVPSACGRKYIESPMVFEIKGGKEAVVFLGSPGSSLSDFNLRKKLRIAFLFFKTPTVLTLSQYDTYIREEKEVNGANINTFWLTYMWQANGSFSFKLGAGKYIGIDIIFEESSRIEMEQVQSVTAYSLHGKFQWKFYLQL